MSTSYLKTTIYSSLLAKEKIDAEKLKMDMYEIRQRGTLLQHMKRANFPIT